MPVTQVVMSEYGSHPVTELCGWSGRPENLGGKPELVAEAFELWSSSNESIRSTIAGLPVQSGGRSMLWELGRKILGTDSPNYPQEVGDCVSFGAKNACEYVQYYSIANGERSQWTRVFPPYLYGCGRVFIGKGKMGWQDGSVGAWQAQAVMAYGTISISSPGCPAYSGAIARSWGNPPGPSQDLVTLGKQHIVKSAAAVKTWEDVVAALTNYYPCTIASNVGFDMTPRSDGFHHYSTHWGHQMCIIGVDDDPSDPYACILNSWGDVHGQVKDFKTGEIWPKGTLRVRKADILAILSEQDSFAYSSLEGFPAQPLSDDAFDLW